MSLRNLWFGLDESIRYVTQRRNFTRKEYGRDKIAAFDTETQAGNIQTWHFATLGTDESKDETGTLDFRASGRNFHFMELYAYLIKNVSYSSRAGKRKYRTFPHFFAWNLSYDLGVMVKEWPNETLDAFTRSATHVLDMRTGVIVETKKKKGRHYHIDGSEMEKNRFAEVFLILKKTMRIKPIGWFVGNEKVSPIHFFDISQFYRERSLQHASETYLGEGKDPMNTALMGVGGEESNRYWEDNYEDIIRYGEKDTLLTARLAWRRMEEYQAAGISPFKPLSAASVARVNMFRINRDLADEYEDPLFHFPHLNDYMEDRVKSGVVGAALASFHGGWFSTSGAGFAPSVVGCDIVSAYPHIMWYLPHIHQLKWLTDRSVGIKGLSQYLKTHQKYWPAFIYAKVTFRDGLPFYPLSMWADDFGCVQNPRRVRRWFTADEIVEAMKWDADIKIIHGCYAVAPESELSETDHDRYITNGIHYPFRPSLDVFYGEKSRIDAIPKSEWTDTDRSTREVVKRMANSLFGIQMATVKEDGGRRSGSVWNPIYGAIITAGCRMRIAEFMRLNNHSILSVATDGIILPESELVVVPENPLPIEGWTLGDWEIEAKGDLLIIGSGVYSVVGESSKTTARGHAAGFAKGKGLNNWIDFCAAYPDLDRIERTFSAPYSMGEARVRMNYGLVGAFREQTSTLTPTMDAAKRPRWDSKPETFGDLLDGWFHSHPPQFLSRRFSDE